MACIIFLLDDAGLWTLNSLLSKSTILNNIWWLWNIHAKPLILLLFLFFLFSFWFPLSLTPYITKLLRHPLHFCPTTRPPANQNEQFQFLSVLHQWLVFSSSQPTGLPCFSFHPHFSCPLYWDPAPPHSPHSSIKDVLGLPHDRSSWYHSQPSQVCKKTFCSTYS